MYYLENVTLTDEQHDAILAALPGDPKDAETRLVAYLQAQVDAVAADHVLKARQRAFAEAGLPAALAAVDLDEDQKAFLLSDGSAKKAARVAAIEAAKASEAPAEAVVEAVVEAPIG